MGGPEGPRDEEPVNDENVSKFRERLQSAENADASAQPQQELSLMERALKLSSQFDPPPGQEQTLPSGKFALLYGRLPREVELLSKRLVRSLCWMLLLQMGLGKNPRTAGCRF